MTTLSKLHPTTISSIKKHVIRLLESNGPMSSTEITYSIDQNFRACITNNQLTFIIKQLNINRLDNEQKKQLGLLTEQTILNIIK